MTVDPYRDFIVAAVVPRAGSPYGGGHANGRIAPAERILAAHPDLRARDIHIAAILGDAAGVRRFLAGDGAAATSPGGPYGWDPLTHLCFSNYLKEDRARTPGFLAAATALLDAGVDPNTGWYAPEDAPHPSWEPVLYGACGVAHHPAMTRLLLERGADPNDGETCYHAPETTDNAALTLLLDTGRLTPDNRAVILLRKLDWHDAAGVRLALSRGADARRPWGKSLTPLHHALARTNDTPIIVELLDHGADPLEVVRGVTGVQRAAREGRGDVLAEFRRRGVPVTMPGVDGLLGALAVGDDDAAREMLARAPALRADVIARGGELLCRWCAAWNWDGMRRLLDLGVPPNAPYEQGDGYLGLSPGSLPIHAAAWLVLPHAVRLLVGRGADVNAIMPKRNATPLRLYVDGCTDSYWTDRRTVEVARLLLDAGARARDIPVPTGYDDLDTFLHERGVAG